MFFSCTASTLMYGMSAGMLLSLLILKGPKWWKDRVQAKRDKEFKEFMRMVDDYRERSEILPLGALSGSKLYIYSGPRPDVSDVSEDEHLFFTITKEHKFIPGPAYDRICKEKAVG